MLQWRAFELQNMERKYSMAFDEKENAVQTDYYECMKCHGFSNNLNSRAIEHAKWCPVMIMKQEEEAGILDIP
jgi:hypothetical protein